MTSRARKSQQKLPRAVVQKIHQRLNLVVRSDDPLSYLAPLHGQWSGYSKIKLGQYRIRLEVDKANKTLIVHKLGHRQNFYEK